MKTVFVGNFSGVATPECLFSYGQYKDDDRYLAVLGSKFGIFFVFAVIFGGVAATGSSRAIASGAALYSFMLVLIASACFTAINITELPNGAYALKTLPSITSETDDFAAMVAYGVCGLFLFLLAIPGVFYLILKKRAQDNTLWGPDSRVTLGSLFMRYRPSCWWYEFVIMGRKLLMAMVAILFPGVVAGILSVIIVGASIALHLAFKPFQNGPQMITVDENTETVADANEDVGVTGVNQDEEVASADQGGERLRYTNEEDGNRGALNRADKLELICMSLLALTYFVGLLSSMIEPKDGDAAAVVMIILVVLIVLSPVCAAIGLSYDVDGNAGGNGDSSLQENENSMDGVGRLENPVFDTSMNMNFS